MIRELVALKLVLDRDSEDRDKAGLRQRDYEIGLELKKQPPGIIDKWFSGKEIRKRNQILQWLHHVLLEDQSGTINERASNIENWVRYIGIVIATTGLVLGIGAAASVFQYDGTRPINILPAVLLFVVLPIILLVYFVVLAVKDSKFGMRFTRQAPEKSILPSPFTLIQKSIISKLSGKKRRELESEIGMIEKNQKTYLPFVIWKLRYWTQLAAIFYMAGALGWLLIKIATTDLAFSWSTTLNISPGAMNTFTSILAAPWSVWIPSATVDLQLIENTQYYRATPSAIPEGADPAEMGRWWGFLLMAMVCYGLLPRMLTLMISDIRSKKGFTHAVITLAKPHGLPGRLERVLAPPGRDTEGRSGNRGSVKQLLASLDIQASSLLLEWGNIKPEEKFYQQLFNGARMDQTHFFRAGHDTLEEDERVLAEIGNLLDREGEHSDIIILTSAWEPPIADFTMFLKDLLRITREDTHIIVLPVSYDEEMLETRYQQDARQWKNVLQRLGEPRLIVEETNQTLTDS